jgi:uncharacterized protein YaeQ
LVSRTMRRQVTVQDGGVTFTDGAGVVEVHPAKWQ